MKQATGAAGAAATITLAAGSAAQVRCLDQVHFSYSAPPTGGRLTIASSGQPTFDVDAPQAGASALVFRSPVRGMPGQTLIITLAGGAGAVIGKVNVLADWLEGPA